MKEKAEKAVTEKERTEQEKIEKERTEYPEELDFLEMEFKQRTWNSIPCDAIVECWNHVFKLRNGSGRKCSPWYGTQLTGTIFEQSALCGLCPECNISGSGNVPSAHGADGTASGMCDLTGGHLSGFLLHRHPGPDGYPGQRLEGTGQRDGTHFAGGSVGNCISVYTVPPFSFSRIR